MPDQVNVDDLEVFRRFRLALLKFSQSATQALITADSQIAHTLTWLENEQTSYWQGQLRKRTEAVARAREAVRQKKLFKDSTGRTPNAAQEEKNLTQCLAAVAAAEQKILAVRKAVPKLEKEADVYRGTVSRLNGTLTVELPQAIALLDRLAGTMEEYVSLQAPAMGVPDASGATAFDESMSRGEDVEMLDAPPPDAPPADAPAEPVPGAQEPVKPTPPAADRKEP
jgi:hypothetical protein